MVTSIFLPKPSPYLSFTRCWILILHIKKYVILEAMLIINSHMKQAFGSRKCAILNYHFFCVFITCSYLAICLFHWSDPKSVFPICWWKGNVPEAEVQVLLSDLIPKCNKIKFLFVMFKVTYNFLLIKSAKLQGNITKAFFLFTQVSYFGIFFIFRKGLKSWIASECVFFPPCLFLESVQQFRTVVFVSNNIMLFLFCHILVFLFTQ